MKKYVLSAVVTSLLVPLAYAMEQGAAPAVEVEVPAVEVEVPVDEAPAVEVEVTAVATLAVEEVAVDLVEVGVEAPVEVAPLDVAEGVPFDPDTQPEEFAQWAAEHPAVEVSTLEVIAVEVEASVEAPHPGGAPVFLGPPDFIEVVDPVEVVPIEDPALLVDDHGHLIEDGQGGVLHGLTPFDENGESTLPCPHMPVEGEPVDQNAIDLAVESGLPVKDNVPQIAVCYFGGVFMEPIDDSGLVDREAVDPTLVEWNRGPMLFHSSPDLPLVVPEPVDGDLVDPKAIDLASQSGTPVDESPRPVVDDSFVTVADGELPQAAPVEATGEITFTAVEDTPSRPLHGDIHPNFRGAITEREPDALAATASGLLAGASPSPSASASPSADAPQLFNDEQRGAVRGLRSDEESAKPRSGMSKLLSKFRKPKSDVVQASASTTDTALSSKLAEVDRLRDTALRTGDQKMLAKADKLEQELRTKSGQATKIPTRTK